LEQFIVINDDMKRLARDFYIKRKEGEREEAMERHERVCARGKALRGEEDGIGNKIDC
jgi:hypothetical protein